ncbi:hypothetical protein M758_8G060200 [Ceratodon purpureus]|nr:hypothetical protein M758_8G060200 [Ceratodon purpureus]
MRGGVLTRSTGKISFDRLFVLGTRNMASSGRLLGLQLPPVPSHLSDFMPACVRSTHTGDAKECSSLAQLSDLPFQPPRTALQGGSPTQASSVGLSAFTPLCPKLGADVKESHSSSALSCSAEQIEVVKAIGEQRAESPSPSGWAPYFSFGGNELGNAKVNSSPGVESCPTSSPEDDITGAFGKEAGVVRSKLGSLLSLEKRNSLVPSHASQLMMDMSTSFTRRAPNVDSKIRLAIQKDSSVSDMIVTRGDPSWTEDKLCNEAWGIEPWHSEERNILMKTLYMMRSDIESLKTVLRSLDLPAARGGPLDLHLYETKGYMPNMHPVMMMTSNSAMSEMNHTSRKPSDEEQTENCVDHLKGDTEFAQTAEKGHSFETDKDLCVSEVPSSKKVEESDEVVSTWTHGDSRKRKQWWRELLKALGLTVWVITGAVLVAKVIGVPNLEVGQNVAYSGFWGRSEDDKTKGSGQGIPSGVVELTFLNFNETIMKRPTFVMFYAPWCPHCQRLHPVWEQLAGVLNKKGYDVQLAIVDATKHTRLADKYEIVGFPSLIMFKRGHPVGRHRGARDIDTLISFIDYNK